MMHIASRMPVLRTDGCRGDYGGRCWNPATCPRAGDFCRTAGLCVLAGEWWGPGSVMANPGSFWGTCRPTFPLPLPHSAAWCRGTKKDRTRPSLGGGGSLSLFFFFFFFFYSTSLFFFFNISILSNC